jgi:hypothetical protein
MDAAGFMWVLDGNTDYYAGHHPGGLNSAVAIVHGLLLSMPACFVLCRPCVCIRSVHGCQLLLEHHRLRGVSSQFLEPDPQLPANAMPL